MGMEALLSVNIVQKGLTRPGLSYMIDTGEWSSARPERRIGAEESNVNKIVTITATGQHVTVERENGYFRTYQPGIESARRLAETLNAREERGRISWMNFHGMTRFASGALNGYTVGIK